MAELRCRHCFKPIHWDEEEIPPDWRHSIPEYPYDDDDPTNDPDLKAAPLTEMQLTVIRDLRKAGLR